MGREYHVSIKGDDTNTGTSTSPLRTISEGAKRALRGDRVIVHEGEYREWVKPVNSGYGDTERIVYTAAEGEKVIIKGSEVISSWSSCGKGVWKSEIDNRIFGDYNPYAVNIDGDWLMRPIDKFLHTGAVYINGKALKECQRKEAIGEKEWYCQVNADTTVIYANFGSYNPAEELVEINVRKSCFTPERTGVNYITVKGFEMAHAATPWAPPTAEQTGMVGPKWSKGWIIENNILHDARCSAVNIGKESSTGDNPYTKYHRKSGYQYQLETVFKAKQAGWCREKIGSHIIRYNTIYDCGQNGIVGNLGGAFSEIYNNHIYNIGTNHEFFGYEIAGIKLHAAIDGMIHNNIIHDCALGTWLDWQAQGLRLSSNLYFNNERDLWVEVTHGPYIVDNNIFASQNNITNNAQGGAYAHNLFMGRIQRYDVRNRSTPYHFNHSTDIAGCAMVYGGDDRYYNNIFCGADEGSEDFRKNWHGGTAFYNGYPASLEEYIKNVMSHGRGDIETFECEKQPVYINCNCYFNGAKPYENEEQFICEETKPMAKAYIEKDRVYVEFNMPLITIPTGRVTTNMLGFTRISELIYENPDGTPLDIDCDFFGNKRSDNPAPGPFENIKAGENKIVVNI